MAYKGPDLSSWQGNIDIGALSSQVDFFIFRGYAGMSKDIKVDRNVQLAIENNKPYGLYMYSYALNEAQAVEEANRLVILANSYAVKPTFLCIDMEDADGYKKRYGMPSNEVLRAMCRVACEVFENAGYYANIYASASWFNNQLNGEELNRYDKWIARWTTRNGKQTGNDTPAEWESAEHCGIWQFTSEGYLNGYNGRLDMNYAYKDFVLGGVTPQPTPSPEPSPEPALRKTNEQLADEVIAGLWGDGDERKRRLTEAGYSWDEVQAIVDARYGKQPTYQTYTVQPGDYLSKIGAKFGVAWQDIANLNSIAGPNYVIYAGQVLKIPSGNVTPQPTPQPTYKTYKVVSGDTLSGIGQKFGVSWKKIAEVNDVKPPKYIIYVGQTLKIPN